MALSTERTFVNLGRSRNGKRPAAIVGPKSTAGGNVSIEKQLEDEQSDHEPVMARWVCDPELAERLGKLSEKLTDARL